MQFQKTPEFQITRIWDYVLGDKILGKKYTKRKIRADSPHSLYETHDWPLPEKEKWSSKFVLLFHNSKKYYCFCSCVLHHICKEVKKKSKFGSMIPYFMYFSSNCSLYIYHKVIAYLLLKNSEKKQHAIMQKV